MYFTVAMPIGPVIPVGPIGPVAPVSVAEPGPLVDRLAQALDNYILL